MLVVFVHQGDEVPEFFSLPERAQGGGGGGKSAMALSGVGDGAGRRRGGGWKRERTYVGTQQIEELERMHTLTKLANQKLCQA